MTEAELWDIVIVGGNAGGVSVAVGSRRVGLEGVRLITDSASIAFPGLIAEAGFDVGYGEKLISVKTEDSAAADAPILVVRTDRHEYRTRGVLIADRPNAAGWAPTIPFVASDRVHLDELPDVHDEDICVIGASDRAIELVSRAADAGNRVVFAASGLVPARLAPAASNTLRRLERERQVTVLYRSTPDQISEVDGFPMAWFDDRRTPDLEFDRVVFAAKRQTMPVDSLNVSSDALASGALWFLGEIPSGAPEITQPSFRVGRAMAEAIYTEKDLAPPPTAVVRTSRHEGAVDELRTEHYNAEITKFEPTHTDLWVLRVRPDTGDSTFVPGQYASLGLGYWEPRVDGAEDPELEVKWDKLIRRSYSISSAIFDEHGYLADEPGSDELEFYIVLVAPTEDNVPALTPRLAMKRPGDRIYLGPKVAGRYTLKPVTEPSDTVVFLGTGTGEAPHNAMVVELLSKGHHGPIVSAVSVRQWADLGYRDKHDQLEQRWSNYHYLPMPTREDDVTKRYLQDAIKDGSVAVAAGRPLSPDNTHVFLCGNPAMIGLPDDGAYPDVEGVVEILSGMGFTLDKRGEPGNVHYEEYW